MQKITTAYGAIDENERVTRSTFLISPEGKVVALWPKISDFASHPGVVLTKLKSIINGSDDTKNDGKNDGENDEEENENDNDENDDENEDEDGDEQEEEDEEDDE